MIPGSSVHIQGSLKVPGFELAFPGELKVFPRASIGGLLPITASVCLPNNSSNLAIMLAHDQLDGLGGLIGVVKGDGADVVV